MREARYDDNDLLLAGAGGHAKVIIDILRSYYRETNLIGITDRDASKKGSSLLDVPVIGTDDIIPELRERGLRKAFVSIGAVKDFQARERLYIFLKKLGFELVNVIHPASTVSAFASLGSGNSIHAGCVLNAGARIGDNCIINTGSIIEHDCIIGNNVHIAPGAAVSGGAVIGDNCLIGLGANVIQGIRIGNNCIVAAGSTVIADVAAGSTVAGVPAKPLKGRGA